MVLPSMADGTLTFNSIECEKEQPGATSQVTVQFPIGNDSPLRRAIIDYIYHYQYCLNISYNEEGTPGLGSAIFLHCLGPVKPFTGGCVAIPEDHMRYVMQHIDADTVVVIDTYAILSGGADWPGSTWPGDK